MPLQRVSLKSFLASAKKALHSPLQQALPLTFVVGNESADLDSLCSAVVYAYLRTYASPSRADTLYIPLSNLPRADLALRPEIIPVLSHASLEPSDLITLSDLPPRAQRNTQLPPDKTNWLLVDHNSLQGDLGSLYGSRVIGCIDHHAEEGKVPRDCGEEPRIVQKSGSCASLIVDHCRGAWDQLSAKSAHKENMSSWNSHLAHLALAPVLIDTTNLTLESRVKPEDLKAVKYLESIITTELGSQFSVTEYFKEVSTAKEDIGKLSLPDIFRKDYKQWTEEESVILGISSAVKDISFLIEKADSEEKFLVALKDFAKKRGLSVCSIMTTSHNDDNFRRELFVWGIDDKGVKAAKEFEGSATEKLGLEQWNGGALDSDQDGQFRRAWWQRRLENSRKEVAPLLRSTISASNDA